MRHEQLKPVTSKQDGEGALASTNPELAQYPILLRHVFTASELLNYQKGVEA